MSLLLCPSLLVLLLVLLMLPMSRSHPLITKDQTKTRSSIPSTGMPDQPDMMDILREPLYGRPLFVPASITMRSTDPKSQEAMKQRASAMVRAQSHLGHRDPMASFPPRHHSLSSSSSEPLHPSSPSSISFRPVSSPVDQEVSAASAPSPSPPVQDDEEEEEEDVYERFDARWIALRSSLQNPRNASIPLHEDSDYSDDE
ncbi:MAG: hypothetical protein DHS80DRAFT_22710 [Piptocephalis tieghemiana]|nr:MAG: hypothetical protein DHS80DRAFT_22710 [Piptocephalis tieghemiana]